MKNESKTNEDHAGFEYEYQVDKQNYISKKISPFEFIWLINSKHKYPVGSEVTVYYFPTNPEIAYLKNGWTGLHVLISLLFLAILVSIRLKIWKLKKRLPVIDNQKNQAST